VDGIANRLRNSRMASRRIIVPLPGRDCSMDAAAKRLHRAAPLRPFPHR
jgi:hypothetical protein